jgi:Uma2 family endonuclease
MSQAATLPTTPTQCLLLSNVDWRTYSRLLQLFAERPGIRLTYDRGELEIMSPLLEHDEDADFLGVLVRALTSELNLPIRGGGSVTLRQRRKKRGLEPDRCYWIASAPRMVGRRRLDLRVDPPPDLAIEADVTRSSLDRLAIYQSLGVPEVWRLQGNTLTFYSLQADGRYQEVPASRSFPLITPADVLTFLQLARQTADQNVVESQFRAWLRQRQAAGGPTP